jgi:hypothetical protein
MPSAHLRFVVVAASLAACAQPLPADRTAYAGEWSGPGTILSITLGGDLAFEQKTRGTTIEILGPTRASRVRKLWHQPTSQVRSRHKAKPEVAVSGKPLICRE